MTIHVDDILTTGPDKILLGQLKEKLMARFSMMDLGEVSLILGMKITRDRSKRTLRIGQTDCTRSILDRFNMKDCNPVSTPSTGAELSLDQPTDTLLDEDGIKLYQSMVGSLLYPSRTTRWDISLRSTTTNKGNEQTLNGSPQKCEACFAVPQRTSGTRHRLQERVLQTSGICRREFCQRSRQAQVYKWLHLSFFWDTHLMGLIASSAHGFKHCRKRASGHHPLYE